MPKPGYYAVRVGKKPGIYNNWTECEMQVKGFPNAKYKKFPTLVHAKNYMNEGLKCQPVQTEPLRKEVELVKEKPSCNDVDSEIINLLYDSVFLSDCGFDEGTIPVITTASDMVTSMPEITYPSSSKGSFYAVHRGRNPGVYKTWAECSFQINDYRNASYRKFDTEEEALQYVKTGGIQKASKRELNNLEIEISNKVVKRQKINTTTKIDYVLQNTEESVVVFTDGASSENGKRRSRAGIGVYWGDNHPLNTSKRIAGRQTNNRAEIYAAVHALNQAKQIGAKKVKLYTDSQFVIHAITDWIKKWKENGWKLATGKDVVNKEDFVALDAAQTDLEVEWIYVKAHAQNKGNDEADRLAVAGSNLILKPENISEFQNFHVESSNEEESVSGPFLLSDTSNSGDDVLPLILPSVQEKNPLYAVHRGRCPGIYSTWTDCEKQVNDFPNPSFRKFYSKEEAEEFVKSGKMIKAQFNIPKCKDDEYVTVFTDGASSCNGQEGAKAGIGVYWGPDNPLNTSMRLPGRQTNNRAEIFAAVHALRQAKQLGMKNIRLYTDSKFVIDGINVWIKNWKKKDWKNANGKPVINKDDFMALDNACQGLNVDWCYVKGHSNNPGNNEADKLAVAGCNKSLSDTIVLT